MLAELKPGAELRAVVNLSKGIERSNMLFCSELVGSYFPSVDYAVISGPSFAKEVAHKKPTVLVVASHREHISIWLRDLLSSERLRLYSSTDVMGVELGGAVKNVIAIASGIIDGLGLGENPRAGLITRGLFEILKLGASLGAKFETLFGLAGLGDLVLTCTSNQSRNYTFGYRLGKGESKQEILDSTAGVAEGVWTAPAVVELANYFKTDIPITEAVVSILEGKITPKQAVQQLMTRKLKWEWEGVRDLISRESRFAGPPDDFQNR